MSGPRGAASVAAGLAPVREARPIREGERIHVVGAGGAGASAAALLAHDAGAVVTGCDPGGPSQYTPAIEAAGIHLDWSHSPEHVLGSARPDRLAVTKALTAIDPDNAELVAARELGVPCEPWQQVIADAACGRILVGIAGTHGKSTCSGWLVHVLVRAGLDPSAFVGALLPPAITGGLASTARTGAGMPFVVEADEYAGNFDAYRPDVAVLTSAEWDHPDVFADGEAVVETFARWLRRSGSTGKVPLLVANVADPGVAAVVGGLRDWRGVVCAVALVDDTKPLLDEARISELAARFATAGGPAVPLLGTIADAGPQGTVLEVAGAGTEGRVLTAHLRLAGRHNAANALCVAGAAIALGISGDGLVAGLAGFAGVGRRLERKGEARGVVVYDDYGHHPTAIRETLAAIRQLEPGRRVWAVYEPLTYHRTAAMLNEFADVLATADAVAVAEIWASRDPDTTITSATALAEATALRRPGLTSVAPGTVDETAAWLALQVGPGDAVLVMGGGKSYQIADLLLEALKRPAGARH
ncbi:MAG TPA: cyanophycin synthetase [Candidatus Limnocylindrales bacterium]